MLSRRGWAVVTVYVALMGWIVYRTAAGHPILGGLLARLGG